MPIAEPHPKGRRSSETALTQQHRQPTRRNSLATTAILENPPSEDSLELRCLPKYTLYIPEHKVRSSHVKLNFPSTSSLTSKDDVSEVLLIPRRSLRSLVNRSREFSPAKYHVYDVAQNLRNSLSLSKIIDLGNSMEAVSLNESKSWNPPTSLLDGESPSDGELGKLADEDDQIADDKYYLVEVGKDADIDPKPEIPDISVSQCVDESQSSLQDSGYSLSQFLTETARSNDGIDKEVFKDDSQTQPDVESASSSDQYAPKEKKSDISDSNNRTLIPIEEISVSDLGEQGNGPSPQSINDMNGSDPFRATKENVPATLGRGSKEDNRYEEGNEDHIAMRQRSTSHSSFKLQDLVYKLFHPGQHHEGEDEVEEHKTEAEISPSLKPKPSLVYKIFHHGGTKDADDDREHHGHHHPHGQDDTGHETDVDEREHASTSTYRKRKKKRSFVDKILHPHHTDDVDEGKEHYDHGSSAEESEQASANITDSEQSKRHSSSSLENGSSDVDHHKKSNGRKRNVFGFFSSRSGSSEGETALHKGKNDLSSDEASKDEPDPKGETGEKLQRRHSKEGSGRRRRPPPLPMPPESDRMSSSENLSPHEAVSKPPRNRLRKRSSSRTSSARRPKQTSSEEIETEHADESTRHDNSKMMASLESPDGHARPFFHKFLLNQSYLRPSSTPVSPSGRLSPNGSHRMPSGEDTSPHLEDHQIPEFEALPELSVESHTYDQAKEFFKEFIHGSPHRRRSHTFSGHIHPGGSSSPKPVPHDDHHLRERYGVCDEVLGKGANGTVRLAHKKSTTPNEKLFAVKRFRKRRKGEKEKEYIKKLTSEFCISSNLHHVNVVETVDLIEDENLGWCEVMEYLPGGNLFDKIATGGELDVFEINCYFRQLINGVTYLHSVGVAHRDLKPENLLLDASGCILKIADFGVSEVFRIVWETKSRKLKGLAGSEPYIAPEEFTIQEYDPTKVDVWACGIIYYTMVHHSVPFLTASENDEQYNSFRKNRLGSYPPIDNLADGPKNMLNSILDPDPDTRTSVEKIREDAWFAAIDFCTTEQKGRYHTHPVCKQGGDKNQ